MKSLTVNDLDATDLYNTSLKAFLKAFPNSTSDIEELKKDLAKNPKSGSVIPGFNSLLYKKRWPQQKYKIGKSGGIRLIYCFDGKKIYLVFVYSKRQMQNHPFKILKNWLKENGFINPETA